MRSRLVERRDDGEDVGDRQAPRGHRRAAGRRSGGGIGADPAEQAAEQRGGDQPALRHDHRRAGLHPQSEEMEVADARGGEAQRQTAERARGRGDRPAGAVVAGGVGGGGGPRKDDGRDQDRIRRGRRLGSLLGFVLPPIFLMERGDLGAGLLIVRRTRIVNRARRCSPGRSSNPAAWRSDAVRTMGTNRSRISLVVAAAATCAINVSQIE